MTLVCRRCGGTAFRMLASADGRSAFECLSCGRASSFDQAQAPNPAAPPKKPDSNPGLD